MKILTGRFVLIVTVLTITIWIGYETYSTLTRTTRQLSVKQELLRELDKEQNREVIDDLSGRIAY